MMVYVVYLSQSNAKIRKSLDYATLSAMVGILNENMIVLFLVPLLHVSVASKEWNIMQ